MDIGIGDCKICIIYLNSIRMLKKTQKTIYMTSITIQNRKDSFKNSVGERKTETRKTQMSSRKGTHFKLRKRQGTKVLEISKMRVLN